MIDSHCHLDFPDFDLDREATLTQCALNNVHDIIVPGVSADTFKRTLTVCDAHASLHCALGLHPMFIDVHQPQDLVTLDQLISQHQPIAVGEIGLDFFNSSQTSATQANKNSSAVKREKQLLFFSKQLIIAKQHKLPVIIHNRKAHDECIRELARINVKGGIIHAFNGSIQHAHKYIGMGFLLGFGGMLTYDRSSKLRRLAKDIPLNAIALETDSPDMTVKQFKGQRNSPEYLPYVQSALSEIKGVSKRQIDDITTQNIRSLFNI